MPGVASPCATCAGPRESSRILSTVTISVFPRHTLMSSGDHQSGSASASSISKVRSGLPSPSAESVTVRFYAPFFTGKFSH